MQTLSQIQKSLKAPKNQRNEFGGFNYRSAEDILEAVKPLLGDAVLTLSDDLVQMGDRIYVKATATLTDGTSTFPVTAYARESETKKGMDPAQITGAASSYARKYALAGLFLLDDNKDPDAQRPPDPGNGNGNGKKTPPKKKIPQKAKAPGEPAPQSGR